jgi:hypothetical protein
MVTDGQKTRAVEWKLCPRLHQGIKDKLAMGKGLTDEDFNECVSQARGHAGGMARAAKMQVPAQPGPQVPPQQAAPQGQAPAPQQPPVPPAKQQAPAPQGKGQPPAKQDEAKPKGAGVGGCRVGVSEGGESVCAP